MSRQGERRGMPPSLVKASARTLKLDFSLAKSRTCSLSMPVVGLKVAVHILERSLSIFVASERGRVLSFRGWDMVVSFAMHSRGRSEGW